MLPTFPMSNLGKDLYLLLQSSQVDPTLQDCTLSMPNDLYTTFRPSYLPLP